MKKGRSRSRGMFGSRWRSLVMRSNFPSVAPLFPPFSSYWKANLKERPLPGPRKESLAL